MDALATISLDFVEAFKAAKQDEREELVEEFLHEQLATKNDLAIEFAPGKYLLTHLGI